MTTKKPQRSQARSIGLMTLINIASAIVGIIQAFVLGLLFGISSGIEIYFVAVAFYQSILKLTQTGQIAEIFTPIYHRLKISHNQQTAFDLLSVLVNWMMGLALVLSAIAFLLADYLMPNLAPGFDANRLVVCIAMFRWIIPLLALSIIESLLSNLLVAEKKFVAPEICRLTCTVIGLALVLLFARQLDVWVMILSLWVSGVANILMFGYLLFRMGYRYRLQFSHPDFRILDIFRNAPSVFGYVGLAQLFSVVFTASLSLLPQGSLAIFTYAQKVTSRINGVILRPASIVFFNHFSMALAEGSQSVATLTDKALRIVLLSTTFACVGALTSGFPGLKALWLSEKFPEPAVWTTYLIICVLCFLPLIRGASLIYRKINMSHQLFRQQYIFLSCVLMADIPLAYYLVPQIGLAGAVGLLIFNTSMMAAASALLLIKRVPDSFALYDWSEIENCIVILVFSTLPVVVVQFNLDMLGIAEQGRIGNLAISIISLATGVSIALATSWCLRISEVRSTVNMATKRIRLEMAKPVNALRSFCQPR